MVRDRTGGLLRGNPVSQALEKAERNLDAVRKVHSMTPEPARPTSRAFTITLARVAGTQGSAIAREVGQLLGWKVYDQELLERIAQDMGLRTRLLKSVDERQQSWLMELVQSFQRDLGKNESRTFVGESAYVHQLIETILALGAKGECVIVGRGAGFILPAEATLRVRLVCPDSVRIAEVRRQLGLTEREAKKQIETIDRERVAFVRAHFFKDATDPLNFDLILNTEQFSVRQSAELIVEALHRREAARKEKESALNASV